MTSSPEAFLLQLGTRIANARHARSLTQAQLAEEIGVDQRSLQRIEAGRTAPSLQRLREIASALNVELSRLLEGNVSSRDEVKRSGAREPRGARDDVATLLRIWERLPEQRRSVALKILRLLTAENLG